MSDDPFTFYPLQKWIISSHTRRGETYEVVMYNDYSWSCECMGHKYRGICSHIDKLRKEVVQLLQPEPEVIEGDGLRIEL